MVQVKLLCVYVHPGGCCWFEVAFVVCVQHIHMSSTHPQAPIGPTTFRGELISAIHTCTPHAPLGREPVDGGEAAGEDDACDRAAAVDRGDDVVVGREVQVVDLSASTYCYDALSSFN